jgi:hypothetical protein
VSRQTPIVDVGGFSLEQNAGGFVIEIDDRDLRRAMNHLSRAMGAIPTGRKMKREISGRLRHLMKPLVEKRRVAVLRLPSKGHPGESMRQAIAKQIRASTRWSAKTGGVSVIQRGRGMPRNFNMAGRAFNRAEGWTPQNLGGVVVHQQVTPVEWFDREADASEARMARHQIIEALDDVAGSLADEIRRIR